MKSTSIKIVITIFIFLSINATAQLNTMRQKIVSPAATQVTQNFVKEGIYFLRITETGKYCGIEGVSTNNGARLVQWDFANQDNHKFYISPAGDGYYLIKAIHSNRYLNVSEQSLNDGATICQWDYVNQDNLKWSFYYNSNSKTYTIKNKQSGKPLGLQTNLSDVTNGILLCINGNTQQTFILQDFNAAIASQSNRTKTANATNLSNSIDIRLADGSIIKRQINPRHTGIKNESSKKILNSVQNGETCETKTAKIDMETKDFVPVTASRYLEYNAPGLIYDVRRFYSGDYTNKQELPNGENRNPITLATTVRNTSSSITEEVRIPTKNNINQAIANLQRGYTTDRLQTSNQSMIYRSSYVENNTEMQLKIGASAHYMMASFEGDMQMKNTKQTKTFYIEAEKEMFTLSTDKPQEGFFNGEVNNSNNWGYISSVSYGVKVIGKIEVENTEEMLSAKFKAMIEMGFAGGSIDFAALSRETNLKTNCFFYVVGGLSEKVTGTNLADAYNRVNEILATVNYKTCMPIRIEFRDLTSGNPVTFKDATNNFTYDVCTPKAIQESNKNYEIKINNLVAIGTDIELYGDIWVELWSPTYGDLKQYRTNDNTLFSLKQNVHLERNQMQQYAYGLPTVQYKNIPANMAKDAEIHIYYNLFDYNTVGGDDHLNQRGGTVFVTKYLPGTKTPLEAFYRTVVPTKDLSGLTSPKILFTDFVDGDGVSIQIACQQSLQMSK